MSGVRVGVDVGGTFTKAVAVDLASGEIVGRAVVPTTHADARGVAAGVVRTVAEVVRSVGAERVDLVTHSTTQAVNALLEGDVGTVGVLGLGRRPELKQARKRTQLERVELSPGRFLRTLPEFLDVSDGLDEAAVHDVLARFRAAGATAVSVAEAFAPDDSTFERRVTAMANEAGLPACASSELTGLYGLELRAVTAALNASILPIAERTAEVVAVGVDAAGVAAPVMVMRGDGGATDLDGFRRAPARTLYSGPAASVAGALRFAGVAEGVVVEVGGTSTNVAAVKRGRPAAVLRPGGQPLDRPAGRGRAGDRGGRRLDAPGAEGEGLRRRAPERAHRRAALRRLQPGGGLGRCSRRAHRAPPRRPRRPPRRGPGRRAAAGPDQHLRRQRARDHAARRLRARGRHRRGGGLRPGRRRAAPPGRRGGPPDAGGVRPGRGRARRPRRWRITT